MNVVEPDIYVPPDIDNVPLPIAADVTLIMRIMTIWYATVLGLVCLFFNRNE